MVPNRAAVARLEPLEPAGWALLNAYGARLAVADAVILTAGPACVGLASGLPLQPVRGQASWTRGETCPAVAWGGYAIPTRDGILFGATHDRGHTDTEVRSADHARNLATLATALPALAARLADQPMEGRASLRATTPDRLPIAGPAPGASGVFVLTGLGSRGFCLAPLLAEHVAALALGAPSPLALELAELGDPDRFLRRAARRS